MSKPAPNESLNALVEVLGDDATREIVRIFLDDFPASFHRLGIAPREEQVRIVHSLKSSSLHMGAQQLSERVAALEDRLGRRGLDLEPADLPALQADFDAIAPSLRTYAGR